MIFPRTLLTAVFALAPLISANPLPDTEGTVPYVPIEIFDDAVPSSLEDRAAKKYACPASANGPGRNWQAHDFTMSQAKAAMKAGSAYQKKKGKAWKPASTDYPHFFNNNEKFTFPCGKSLAEFPIRMDGKAAAAGQTDVKQVPDRVIYEYSWDKKKKGKLNTKVCGVIRHGPGPFILCPAK